MKNVLFVILLVAAAVFGAFSFHLKNQLAQTQSALDKAQAELTKVQNELAEQSAAVEKAKLAERKANTLQSVLSEVSAYANQQSQQVTQLQASLAAKISDTNKPANPFAALFKDPKMREMIKAQQKTIMGTMIDKQYAALIQQLNLPPDKAAALKDLLQQKILAASDAGMSLLDGSMDATQRADAMKQIQNQKADFDNQISQLLGTDDYQTLQNYEKTIPDRTTVSQFNAQLADNGMALSADQQEQLAQALNTARSDFKWTTDLNNPNPASGDYTSLFTEQNISKYEQEKEQFDQQFLNQAQSILTPDQLAKFQEYQAAQRQMQTAGMKMAAQMFGSKNQ